ncbi:hypothetical protein C9374_011464 [Naegleria lovaniensis]|uniref:Uncharacterized protein n=1 Tax=Naegleria lovaniensis TaxID=51637 RepID=A0AA88KRJ9_NAELO|nr:uncharacterized protein C9374_011464 [Naegleria lovaniensis]KAG2392739.1 hypothetical protein C9374_011464 [Naegleria lovaniensis]
MRLTLSNPPSEQQQGEPTKKRKSRKHNTGKPKQKYFDSDSGSDESDDEITCMGSGSQPISIASSPSSQEQVVSTLSSLPSSTHQDLANTEEYTECIRQETVERDYCDLEDITNVPPLNSQFSSRENLGSMLCMDIGSSFSKCCSLDITQQCVKMNSLTFASPSSSNKAKKYDLLPTSIYYSLTDKTFIIGLHEEEQQISSSHQTSIPSNNSMIKLHSIKKLFSIQELIDFTWKNESVEITLRVSQVMFELVKGLISLLVQARDASSRKISKQYTSAMFTVPTGTNKNIQKVFRNCVKRALDHTLCHPIPIEKVYIVEEFVLLKYCADSLYQTLTDDTVLLPIVHSSMNGTTQTPHNQTTTTTLLVDVGHLTTDVTVLSHNDVIKYASGDVGGVYMLYDVMRRNNIPPETTMHAIFNSDVSPHTVLAPIEHAIIDTFKKIIYPIFDVIIEFSVSDVVFCGAIISNAYFNNIIKQLVTPEELLNFQRARERYFKPEYIRMNGYPFTLHCIESGGSTLLLGAKHLVASSWDVHTAKPLVFKAEIEPSQCYCGLLFREDDDNDGPIYGISVTDCIYDLFIRQDLELFIICIRNTRNIENIKKDHITSSNFELVGVSEFIRFTTLEIMVETSKIKTTNLHFFLKCHLDESFYNLAFYYTRSGHYYRTHLKISREGRLERISVNDAVHYIFKPENEKTTWYGLNYYCTFFIRAGTSYRCKKGEAKAALSKEVMKELRPIQKAGTSTYDFVEIPAHNESDRAIVEERSSRACVGCACTVDPSNRHEVTTKTFKDYARYLEAATGKRVDRCGLVCNKCYNIYYKAKKKDESNLLNGSDNPTLPKKKKKQ